MVTISSLPALNIPFTKTNFLVGSSNTVLLHNNVSLLSISKKKKHSSCKAGLLTQLAPATCAVYGTLLLGGGLFAYSRSGSKGSLLGGASGGALMAAAYYLMQSPETKSIGDALGFGSALLFSSVFVIRLVASRKLIPAGPLLGLSVGALAVFVSAYMQDKI